jgi:transposase
MEATMKETIREFLPGRRAMPLPEDVKLALEAHIAVIATHSMRIEVIERRIKEQLVPCAEYRLLESVPGIGRTLAWVFIEAANFTGCCSGQMPFIR